MNIEIGIFSCVLGSIHRCQYESSTLIWSSPLELWFHIALGEWRRLRKIVQIQSNEIFNAAFRILFIFNADLLGRTITSRSYHGSCIQTNLPTWNRHQTIAIDNRRSQSKSTWQCSIENYCLVVASSVYTYLFRWRIVSSVPPRICSMYSYLYILSRHSLRCQWIWNMF